MLLYRLRSGLLVVVICTFVLVVLVTKRSQLLCIQLVLTHRSATSGVWESSNSCVRYGQTIGQTDSNHGGGGVLLLLYGLGVCFCLISI